MLFAATQVMAQTQTVVLTTTKTAGQSLSFNVTAGDVNVDWGDGTVVPVTSKGYDEPVTGTVKGSTITISSANLQMVDCSSCELTNVNISGAPALTTLYCGKNALTELSLSSNKTLRSLDCSNNQLTKLTIPASSSLINLDCSQNQLSSLTVSVCPSLETLICSNNQITTLTVSSNPKLKTLWCENNVLKRLYLSNNTALESILAGGNQISIYRIATMPELTDCWLNDNQIAELDLSASTKLTTINIENNAMTTLSLPSLSSIYGFYAGGNSLAFNAMYSTTEAKNYSYGSSSTYTLPVTQATVNTFFNINVPTVDAANKSISISYTWYNADGTQLVKGTDYRAGAGIFYFYKTFENVYCVMTSDTYYPGLTLKSSPINIVLANGINTATAQKDFSYEVNNGSIRMSAEKPQNISIYSPEGKLIWQGTVNSEGTRVNLSKGVYIVGGTKIAIL